MLPLKKFNSNLEIQFSFIIQIILNKALVNNCISLQTQVFIVNSPRNQYTLIAETSFVLNWIYFFCPISSIQWKSHKTNVLLTSIFYGFVSDVDDILISRLYMCPGQLTRQRATARDDWLEPTINTWAHQHCPRDRVTEPNNSINLHPINHQGLLGCFSGKILHPIKVHEGSPLATEKSHTL